MITPPPYNPPREATLEERKEHFMIQYVLARAYFMENTEVVGITQAASDAWNMIQKLKYR